MKPELTVIVPCYNEGSRLGPFFNLIRENRDLNWEWLFVNDGSKDDTAVLVQELAKEIPAVVLEDIQPNRGKGHAVKRGMSIAKGELVGFVDADLAASPLEFNRFLDRKLLNNGEEIIIGIRLKTHEGHVKRLWHRHLMGRVFQTLVSNITGLNVYDTQCGFKLMNQDTARRIASHMACDGFCFDVELLMLADKMDIIIREEKINWEEKGDSRIRIKHIINMFFDIMRIAKRVKKKKLD